MMRRIWLLVLLLAIGVVGCGGGEEGHVGAIVVPEPHASDANAQEVASIWADGENQTFLLADRQGWDNAHWGLLVADFLRHAARARAGVTGQDEEVVLAEIRQAFDAEWKSPTDTVTGGRE